MNTGFLHVFHDAADDDLTGVIADGVHVDLGGVLEESIDQHRTFGGQATLLAQTAETRQFGHGPGEVIAIVDDLHGPTAQYVTGSHQHREADTVDDVERLLQVDGRATRRLRDVQRRAQRVPLLAVLGEIDGRRRGSRDQLDGDLARQLQRCLATQRHDHLRGATTGGGGLGGDDVEHVLLRERLEVETIAGVVIRRHRLGVAVHHHRLEAGVAQGERRVHAAVVELDSLTDAIRARTQDDDALTIRRANLVLVLVGGIVIRSLGGELGRARVHGLVRGDDPGDLASRANCCFVDTPEMGQLGVTEAQPLHPTPRRARHRTGRLVGHGGALFHDHRHLVEEPRIDPTRVVDAIDRYATAQQLADLEDALGRGDAHRCQQFVVGHRGQLALGRITAETRATLLQRTQRLLQALGEGAPDRHDLAHALHLRAQHSAGAGQLLEGPARDLGDDVVDGGFETGRSGTRDVVGDFVERVSDRQLRGDLGDREAGGLGGQGTAARDARVHLDDDLITGERIHGELHVRAPGLHAHATDAGEGRVAHALVLHVAEGLRGRHGDGVAGVHAHRIEVLDRADDHAVVGAVAHHLEFVFLPTGDALLDEDLVDRTGRQTVGRQDRELLGGRGDSGAATTEDVRGPDDGGQSDRLDDLHGFVHGVRDATGRNRQADLQHGLLELVAILGGGDGLGVGADEFGGSRHSDQAALEQGHGGVQTGLAAQRGQNGIGLLAFDDARHHFPRERFDVGAVGEIGVGHDGRRIRVGQDDAITLFLQHATGLGTRVVELARLPDDDGAGADDEDRREVGALGHLRCSRSS